MKLCLANFAFRSALNKMLPFMFAPPAFFLVSNKPNMTYKEVSETDESVILIDIGIDIGIDVEWSHRFPALSCPVLNVDIQPSDVTCDSTYCISLILTSLHLSHCLCIRSDIENSERDNEKHFPNCRYGSIRNNLETQEASFQASCFLNAEGNAKD